MTEAIERVIERIEDRRAEAVTARTANIGRAESKHHGRVAGLDEALEIIAEETVAEIDYEGKAAVEEGDTA